MITLDTVTQELMKQLREALGEGSPLADAIEQLFVEYFHTPIFQSRDDKIAELEKFIRGNRYSFVMTAEDKKIYDGIICQCEEPVDAGSDLPDVFHKCKTCGKYID